MKRAPRRKVRELLRSAHDWDLVRELAPPPSPHPPPLNWYCSSPDALLMMRISNLSDSSVLWHASYSF
jgi:hypothetical protein